MREPVYDPLNDEQPNIRDEFAIREQTLPMCVMNTTLHLAAYLGIKPDQFKPEIHLPMAIAKWRYACADAMLKARARE